MKTITHFFPVALLAIFLPGALLHSQKAPSSKYGVSTQRLQTMVSILAADSLEGRRAGTKGEQMAVDYITAQYKAMGIAPAFSGSYTQPYTIHEGPTLTAGSQVVINDQTLAFKTDFIPFVWSGTQPIKMSASPALKEQGAPWLIEYADIQKELANNPHLLPGAAIRARAAQVAAKGATALIVYNHGAEKDDIRFDAKDDSKPVNIPVYFITHAGTQKANILPDDFAHINAQTAFEPKSRQSYNVAAYIDNKAPYTIVIGAHLDHLGYGEDGNSRDTELPSLHNGADDNASGTAALIELARAIKDDIAKKKKKKALPAIAQANYLFAHFSGEELGLFGSKFMADNMPVSLANVAYMINLDMVGRLPENNTLTVGGYGTSPTWATALETPVKKQFIIKIDSAGAGPSDHTSFYRKDIPVLFFFTGLHTDYHKPSDDADKINYAGQAAIVQYILEIINNTAPHGKPAFTKTREQTMGTASFKVSLGIMPDYTYSGIGIKAEGVIDGRPAQKAGLQAGDIITKLGDIDISGMEVYMQALGKFAKGQTVPITYLRNGKTMQGTVNF